MASSVADWSRVSERANITVFRDHLTDRDAVAERLAPFAVLAGISYSVAREWFQIKGFPRVQGVVFWQDFIQWRNLQNGGKHFSQNYPQPVTSDNSTAFKRPHTAGLPARAAQILLEAVK